MNHRGKLLFVIACGIIGAILSLSLLPGLINLVGNKLYSINREIEGNEKNKKAPITYTPDSGSIKTPDQVTPNNDPIKETPENPENPTNGTEVKPGEEQTEGSDATQKPKKPPIRVSTEEPVLDPTFPTNPFALGLLGLIAGAAAGGFLLRKWEQFVINWEKMPSGDKVTLMLGTFTGVVAGILVSMPFLITLQGRPEGTLLTIGLVIGCSAAMVYLLRSLAPYLPWETSGGKSKRTGLKILDTNVLIDGRVYDLIRTGFLDGDLYVPEFVLRELQHIADSADGLRRQRGRRGLEVLKRIQAEFEVEIGSRDRYAGNSLEEVDDRLVKLAKALGADLVSNDFNLNRRATIQEIKVLNVNDLALALRPNVLPGETMEITVIKEGNQGGQGVGYLNDGTMVVVEGGNELIGQTTVVEVTQVIQTERGKMIFADASAKTSDVK